MSQNNPFADSYQPTPVHPEGKDSKGGKRWPTIWLCVAGATILMCCGVGTAGYIVIQRMAGPVTTVELPSREGEDFQGDAIVYNLALEKIVLAKPTDLTAREEQTGSPGDKAFGTACDDAELVDLLKNSLDALSEGEEVSLNTRLFTEAIDRSPLNTTPLGITDRLTLRNWFRLYTPAPDTYSQSYRVLNISMRSEDVARVDLVFYSTYNQAESHQWFLAKESGGGWSLYDWQRLEYGRRMSDEYAAYLRGSPLLMDGYDKAMEMAGDASDLFEEGKTEEGRAKLLQCERRRMLPTDQGISRLRIAYVWMSLDEYDEALRVLKSVRAPDKIWGVWPSIAVCHFVLEDYDEALVAVDRAKQQSPHHPNVSLTLMQTLDELEKPDMAVEAAIAGLRICPDDENFIDRVIDAGRPQDIPDLLVSLAACDETYRWLQLVNHAEDNQDWAATVRKACEGNRRVPKIVPGLIAAQAEEDDDLAAKLYLEAIEVADDESWKSVAVSRHTMIRTQQGKFAELFAESGDLEAVINEIAWNVFDDEFYQEAQDLLDALESDPSYTKLPWAKGVTGWCHYELKNYEDAIVDLEACADWAADNADSISEDDDWIPNTVDYYIAQSMLEANRFSDALERFPDDVSRHDQIANHILAREDTALQKEFSSHDKGFK